MEYVNSKKLEAVAIFIGETEVEGNCICDNFNEVLEENKINVSCTASNCKSNCPFYSKDNFLNWIKKPTKKLSIREVKRPKAVDFVEYINNDDAAPIDYPNYAEALERYCTDLENLFANLEYDLDNAECENKALLEKLSKIRDVLDEGY